MQTQIEKITEIIEGLEKQIHLIKSRSWRWNFNSPDEKIFELARLKKKVEQYEAMLMDAQAINN